MAQRLWSRVREFVVYCLIGGSGVLLDCVVFATLTLWCDVHYQLANAIGVTLGICNNFFLNAFFNFRRTNRLWLRFLSFYGVGMLGLGISAGMLWFLLEYWGMRVLSAKIVTLFVVTVVQFSLNKLVTFRKGEVR